MVFLRLRPLALKKNNFSFASAALIIVKREACLALNFSTAVSPNSLNLRSRRSEISVSDRGRNSYATSSIAINFNIAHIKTLLLPISPLAHDLKDLPVRCSLMCSRRNRFVTRTGISQAAFTTSTNPSRRGQKDSNRKPLKRRT